MSSDEGRQEEEEGGVGQVALVVGVVAALEQEPVNSNFKKTEQKQSLSVVPEKRSDVGGRKHCFSVVT